jgi:hypothetical protein
MMIGFLVCITPGGVWDVEIEVEMPKLQIRAKSGLIEEASWLSCYLQERILANSCQDAKSTPSICHGGSKELCIGYF